MAHKGWACKLHLFPSKIQLLKVPEPKSWKFGHPHPRSKTVPKRCWWRQNFGFPGTRNGWVRQNWFLKVGSQTVENLGLIGFKTFHPVHLCLEWQYWGPKETSRLKFKNLNQKIFDSKNLIWFKKIFIKFKIWLSFDKTRTCKNKIKYDLQNH